MCLPFLYNSAVDAVFQLGNDGFRCSQSSPASPGLEKDRSWFLLFIPFSSGVAVIFILALTYFFPPRYTRRTIQERRTRSPPIPKEPTRHGRFPHYPLLRVRPRSLPRPLLLPHWPRSAQTSSPKSILPRCRIQHSQISCN